MVRVLDLWLGFFPALGDVIKPGATSLVREIRAGDFVVGNIFWESIFECE